MCTCSHASDAVFHEQNLLMFACLGFQVTMEWSDQSIFKNEEFQWCVLYESSYIILSTGNNFFNQLRVERESYGKMCFPLHHSTWT